MKSAKVRCKWCKGHVQGYVQRHIQRCDQGIVQEFVQDVIRYLSKDCKSRVQKSAKLCTCRYLCPYHHWDQGAKGARDCEHVCGCVHG